MLSKFRLLCEVSSRLGIINILSFLYKRTLDRILGKTLNLNRIGKAYYRGRLNIKGYPHPLTFRYGSSDSQVFSQIFIWNEYKFLSQLKNVDLILDCGANVGYSSIYFLEMFPNAHVIAIEPDQRNCEILELNLAPYRDRITTIRTGILSHPAALKVCSGEFRDGLEWATVVRECKEDEEADIKALDIYTILQSYGYERIDILKIDIEGSEAVVFGSNYENWIDKVQTFVIELHGQDCSDIFYHALQSDSFDFSSFGDVHIAHRQGAQTEKIITSL